MRLDGSSTISTPTILSGTTQLFTASQSSSTVTVTMLVNDECHVTLSYSTVGTSSIGAPTINGNVNNLTSSSNAVGGTYNSLWTIDFDVIGDFTITGYTSSTNLVSIMEVTSLEAD